MLTEVMDILDNVSPQWPTYYRTRNRRQYICSTGANIMLSQNIYFVKSKNKTKSVCKQIDKIFSVSRINVASCPFLYYPHY